VADGVFRAELNEFLRRELAEDGFAGVDVRQASQRVEITIHATRTKEVLGENDRRIKELTALIQQRFGFTEGGVACFAEKVQPRGLSAVAQAESLRYKLLGGLAVRRACYSVLKFIMDQEAVVGCEIIVSGKLRAQRAKSMKFRDGYMLKSGTAPNFFVKKCVRHVLLRQGVLGIKVLIMLKHDPTGKTGPKRPLPDVVTVMPPKEQ